MNKISTQTRRQFMAAMGMGAAALAVGRLARAAEPKDPRPNVLYIMADDHTSQAIGVYGSRLAKLNPTPNIDKLAHQGMRFDDVFCTNAICTPSRATIITGQYGHINGVRALPGRLATEKQALPILMRAGGYETAMIGKWHLQAQPNFDYYAVLPGQGSYFNPVFRILDTVKKPQGFWRLEDTKWPNTYLARAGGYDSTHCTDAVLSLGLNWLKNRKATDKPFFLCLQFKAPHDNFENAERYDFLYEDVQIPEPPSLWKRGNHGPIGRPRYGTSIGKRNPRRNMGMHMHVDPNLPDDQYMREAYQRYLKKYLRCVKGVDDAVGKVLDELDRQGMADNTLICYTGDQGFMLGEHDYIDKRWIYEEAMRMPFIVRYPAKVKAGGTNQDLIGNIDFAPMILDAAGLKVPADMQGRSFYPMLLGKEAPADWRDAIYYRYWLNRVSHENPAHYGVRTKKYKLIFFYGLPLDVPYAKPAVDPYWEMYDLSKDPHEMNNVYEDPAYHDIREQLKKKLLELKKQYKDTDEKYPELMKVRAKYWK